MATIPRPRGVAISMASFYRPEVPFRCLDGSKEIPFEYVNDDYCDCSDGSDEPGTSACPQGKFHCTNAGHKPLNILSSRVNDGICDCCDGTDEWDGNIDCVNNCKELGKKMREESERLRHLQQEGYNLKLKYIEEGKQTKELKRAELEQLERTKVEMEAVKNEMEAKKNEAEGPEKEAKARHEEAWKEELERRKDEKEKLQALVAFDELDTNDDQKIDLSEIKAQSMFDVDSDGKVTDDEAREHLEGEEESDLDHFVEKVWPNIKQFYKPPGTEEPAKGENQDGTAETPHLEADNTDIDDNDDDDDEYDDEDDEVEPPTPEVVVPSADVPAQDSKETNTTEEEEKMPDYDDATKTLIAAADEARQKFSEAENALRDTENKIRDLHSYLAIDYGPDDEYSVLKEHCFEYTDREYTYKLCGFDKASQKPKAGGHETSLGIWGRWDGPADDKYAIQKYENGLSCWNGPNRSVRVILKCGTEHKLTSASEPSRCEYAFDFETPARCSAPPPRLNEDVHDEL